MLGKILGGRYQINSPLGGGGFGTTFIAEDLHLPGHPQCVVKQLKPSGSNDDSSAFQEVRRLFNQEAEVLYQLGNYPQIPRLFAHFEEDREFYLVQELIEGHELRQEITSGKPRAEGLVIPLLREILEILEFVHQQDVIHRDIKPANFIRRRLDGQLFLIDFGAVKQIRSTGIRDRGQISLTIAIGSPGYMPNEQMAGKPRFCSDLYALGMMCIQALTGVHPRDLKEDSKTGEVCWRDLTAVSSAFGDILDRLVRYDYRERYQTASEVLQDLHTLSPTLLMPGVTLTPVTETIPNLETLPPQEILSETLCSECGLDYSELCQHLTDQNWKAADQATKLLLFQSVNREMEAELSPEDLEKLPCSDLQTIDYLWLKHSQGHFGLSVQKRIYEELGQQSRNTGQKIWKRFGDRIGWRIDDNWLDYDAFTFSLDAPKGHLPGGILADWAQPLHRGEFAASLFWRDAYFSRLAACGLAGNPIGNQDQLNSAIGINYSRLRDLLAAGHWKEADIETQQLMLKGVQREREGWIRCTDLDHLPCTDLQTLDRLWVKYSQGRFGFSVQYRIWQQVEGSATNDYDTSCGFADLVGWRVQNQWILWEQLNFTLSAPVGHLPALAIDGGEGFGSEPGEASIFARLEKCGLVS